MISGIKKWRNVISQAVPSLIAIIIVELVNVEVYLSGPVSKGVFMLLIWISLQMIPGFVFGYISDLNFRKATLIFSQLLGLIGGLILAIFGFETWVLILIALTFNPLPVARAALLDHFPHHSTVKLVAITFLAQYLPWAFFEVLSKVDYKIVVYWILGALALNTTLTIFLFKGELPERKTTEHKSPIRSLKTSGMLVRVLLAFVLAETCFYLLWTYLEYDAGGHHSVTIVNITTLIGLSIAMLYTRLPHFSLITLFYSIGAAMIFMALMQCFVRNSLCSENLVTSISYYAVIGGLYLPFVTDGVIRMLGPRHRASGSALIEFGDTIAAFIAPILILILQKNSLKILVVIVLILSIASILQWQAEKKMAHYR